MDPSSLAALVLLIATAVLLVIGTPIAIAVGVASALATVVIFSPDQAALTMSQRIFTGINSFPLLAIPFFILAGVIMNNGGIALRLVDAAKVLVGKMPGPLLQANIASNAMFGAVSGSAVAAAAAVGSTIAPLQKKEGYDAKFAAATNIASAPSGMLIPPSNTLIVYSLVSSTSVAALFMAGYVPGILWALACMVVAFLYARRRNELKVGTLPGFATSLKTVVAAGPAMFMIVVVIGGILLGFFTPTEAAVIAVLYSLVLSFIYRAITVKDLPRILLESTETTAIVMFLIGVSSSMSWLMSYAQVPGIISNLILSISDSKFVVMALITLALLIVGTFMDATPAVLIFTPIFLPVAVGFGIDPVHFGILMVMNLCVGVITPPVGTVLFVGARVGNVEMESVIRPMLGYYAAIFAMLLLVVYIPDLSLWLPRLVGLM